MALGKTALQSALEGAHQQGSISILAPAGLKCDINGSAAQLQTLHRSILCPDTATVALTAKPIIVAASCGPLGAFFHVPEFLLLDTSNGTEESVTLLEMRMFADQIGYPVLIKGSKHGALLCHSWLQLRGVITTQDWVQQGAFIQNCVRGWEKCMAFAAFEGHLLGARATYFQLSICNIAWDYLLPL